MIGTELSYHSYLLCYKFFEILSNNLPEVPHLETHGTRAGNSDLRGSRSSVLSDVSPRHLLVGTEVGFSSTGRKLDNIQQAVQRLILEVSWGASPNAHTSPTHLFLETSFHAENICLGPNWGVWDRASCFLEAICWKTVLRRELEMVFEHLLPIRPKAGEFVLPTSFNPYLIFVE